MVQVVGQLGDTADDDESMLPQKRIALIQFEDAETARCLVEMSQSDEGFGICGRWVRVNFSISYQPNGITATRNISGPSWRLSA